MFQPAAAPPKIKRARKSDPIDEDSRRSDDTSGVSSDEEPSNSEVMYIYVINNLCMMCMPSSN